MEQLSKDRRIIRLEETESTNLYLKQLAREEHLEEGSMVIADFQTVGEADGEFLVFFERRKSLIQPVDLSQGGTGQ
jgi:BirA family biotin operon repressor/biotin-[acetyl-CoA-carboxylase] ligase